MLKSVVDEKFFLYCIEQGTDILGSKSDVLSYVAMHNAKIINDRFMEIL